MRIPIPLKMWFTRTVLALVALLLMDSATASQLISPQGGVTNIVISVPTGKMLEIRDMDVKSNGQAIAYHSRSVTITLSKPTAFGTNDSIIFSNMGNPNHEKPFPIYFQGPIEMGFVLTNTSLYVEYKTLDSISAETVFLKDSDLSISIQEGKSFRILSFEYHPFMGGIYAPQDNFYRLRSGNTTTHPIEFRRLFWRNTSLKIDGPSGVEIRKDDNDYEENYNVAGFITYLIQDEAVSLSDGLQTPQGNSVVVEKSENLQTWKPSVVIPTSGASKQFFRLKTDK